MVSPDTNSKAHFSPALKLKGVRVLLVEDEADQA
jgi:hypothetical protein